MNGLSFVSTLQWLAGAGGPSRESTIESLDRNQVLLRDYLFCPSTCVLQSIMSEIRECLSDQFYSAPCKL